MATQARIRRKKRAPKIALASIFDPRAVFFIEDTTRDEALTTMVNGMSVQDKENFFQALLKREDLVSTAIGSSIAIPHAKLNELDRFYLGIGIVKGKGIEWGARDNLPVRIIMLLGGPKGAESQYLGLLSQTTSMLRDHRLDIQNATSPEQVAQIISLQECYGS